MKRVLLFRFLVFSIIAVFAFLICKYGFYRETKVSFPEKVVTVYRQLDANNHYYYYLQISSSHNLKYHINITLDQANSYLHKGYYMGEWYEMHLTLHFLFWFLVTIIFIYYIWSICTLWTCLYNEHRGDFTRPWNCCNELCSARCELYNSIDEYDLTPVKDKWYNFWGY